MTRVLRILSQPFATASAMFLGRVLLVLLLAGAAVACGGSTKETADASNAYDANDEDAALVPCGDAACSASTRAPPATSLGSGAADMVQAGDATSNATSPF